MTATSLLSDVPFTLASTLFSFTNCTDNSSAPSMTWLFVSINNSVSFLLTIIPDPAPSEYCYTTKKLGPKFPFFTKVFDVIATIEGITSSTTSETSVIYIPSFILLDVSV